MRFVPSPGSFSFTLGPFCKKALEIEGGLISSRGVDIGMSFRTQGDHAGFKWWCDLWRLFIAIRFYDTRHWNWEKGRFYEPDEEPVFEGYPHE